MAAILDSEDRNKAVAVVTNNTYTALIGHVVLNALPENFKVKLFDEMKITEEDFMASVANVVLEIMPYEEFVRRAEALKLRIESNTEAEDVYDDNSEPISDDTANDVLYMNGLIMGAVESQLATFFREVDALPDTVQGLDSLTIKNEAPDSIKNIINKDEVKNFTLETMKAITSDIRNDIELKEEAEKKEQDLISKVNENESETEGSVDDASTDDTMVEDTKSNDNNIEFANEPDNMDLGDDEPLDDSEETTPEDTSTSDDTEIPSMDGDVTPEGASDENADMSTDVQPDTSADGGVGVEGDSLADMTSEDNSSGSANDITDDADGNINFGDAPDLGDDEPLDDDTFVLSDDDNMVPPEDIEATTMDNDTGEFGMDSDDSVSVDDDDFDFNPVDETEMGDTDDFTSDVPNIGDDVSSSDSDIADDFEPISEDDFSQDKRASDVFQESQKNIIRRKVSYIESIQAASLRMFKQEVMKTTGVKRPVLLSETSIVNATNIQLRLLAEAASGKNISSMTKEELKEMLTQKSKVASLALSTLQKTSIVNKTEFLTEYEKDPNKALSKYMSKNRGIYTGVLQQILDYLFMITSFALIKVTAATVLGPGGVIVSNLVGATLLSVVTGDKIIPALIAIFGIATGTAVFAIADITVGFILMTLATIFLVVRIINYIKGIKVVTKEVDSILKHIQTMPGLTDEERRVMSEKAVDIYEGERAKGPSNIFDRLKQGVLFGKAMVRFVTADYYVNRLG